MFPFRPATPGGKGNLKERGGSDVAFNQRSAGTGPAVTERLETKTLPGLTRKTRCPSRGA